MVQFGKDSRGVADAVDLRREDCGVCSWKYVRKTEEKSEGNEPEGPTGVLEKNTHVKKVGELPHPLHLNVESLPCTAECKRTQIKNTRSREMRSKVLHSLTQL
jgi:hypothetical protein